MNRDTRSSYPPTAVHLPGSPTNNRDTRASSVFPYSASTSLARPPTNYSSQSWLSKNNNNQARPPIPLPSLPAFADDNAEVLFEADTNGETPLYARSDWGHDERLEEGEDGEAEQQSGTVWSKSSWAGRSIDTRLAGIQEEDEDEDEDEDPRHSGNPDALHQGLKERTDFGGLMVDSPLPLEVGLDTKKGGRRSLPPLSGYEINQPGLRDTQRTSLPATLDSHAGQNPQKSPGPGQAQGGSFPRQLDPYNGLEPFKDLTTRDNQQARKRNPFMPEHSPDLLMSPTRQQKLGRMSVIPPRYTLPSDTDPITLNQSRLNSNSSLGSNQTLPHESAPKRSTSPWTWRDRKFVRYYLIYRVFCITLCSLIGALLVTFSSGMGSGVSAIITASGQTFVLSGGNGVDVALGVSGWCQVGVNNPTCSAYTVGNFANADATLIIPGNALLSALDTLLLASTCLAWISAAYQITLCFFHWYLHYALSIPLDHITEAITSSSSTAGGHLSKKKTTEGDLYNPVDPGPSSQTGQDDSEQIQRMVDLMVKCQRPPYEGYLWLWWAWWGHLMGPVGFIYSLLSGICLLCSFFVAVGFEREVITATSSSGVNLGVGSYIPFIAFLLNIDNFICGIRYLIISPRNSFETFLNPPPPSAAAVLLPPSSQGMQHLRLTNASSFYAPKPPTPSSSYPHFNLHPNGTPVSDRGGNNILDPMNPDARGTFVSRTRDPTHDIDEETKRWLKAYPDDPELVPIIAGLRTNQHPSEDFLLSEVGLLYLKPVADEQALLVPPAGMIRQEILQDAHLDPDDGMTENGLHNSGGGIRDLGEAGSLGHWGVIKMLEVLSGTFWWSGIEGDVERLVDQCEICRKRGYGRGPSAAFAMGGAEDGQKTGWTAGESAMAAEMAFAMRKAKEEDEDLL